MMKMHCAVVILAATFLGLVSAQLSADYDEGGESATTSIATRSKPPKDWSFLAEDSNVDPSTPEGKRAIAANDTIDNSATTHYDEGGESATTSIATRSKPPKDWSFLAEDSNVDPSTPEGKRAIAANDTIDNSATTHYTYSSSLLDTLVNATYCYNERDLGDGWNGFSSFADDCKYDGPGNYQFQICKGDSRYAMRCEVTRQNQYNWRVIGYNGFKQEGCYGDECFKTDCELGAKNIMFSTKTEPDALMVLTTKHTVTYHIKLRSALEDVGFVALVAPASSITSTWCNAKTILSVSKDGVSRADLGFLGYRCGNAVNCSMPSEGTIRQVQRMLEREYPLTEIILMTGLPALILVVFPVTTALLTIYCCGRRRKRGGAKQSQGHAEAGAAKAQMGQASARVETAPPPYQSPV